MKMHVIGALLASTAFAASAYAAGDTKLMSVSQFCAEQRLSAADLADCENELSIAATDEERTAIMRAYESKPGTSTPLRNDLRANDAGVKRADQPTTPTTANGVVQRTVVAPAPSTTVIVPPSGASTTLGVVEPMPEPVPAPTTPLRNDLRSDEAGVKGAKQSTDPRLNP